MIKKTHLLLICITVIQSVIYSQASDYDLNKKYWYYKSRFNNDFVSVGTEAGQSLPFNQNFFNK